MYLSDRANTKLFTYGMHPHNSTTYLGKGSADIVVVMDVFLVSTLCKYNLRKGDLFDLSWARV